MSILEKIYESTLEFLLPLDLETTYKVIVREAIKLVDGRHATILLASEKELKVAYATSPFSYKIDVRKGGSRYEVYNTRQAKILYTSDVKKLEKVHPHLVDLKPKSIILVPLTNRNEAIGVLTIASKKNRYFKAKDLEILKLFGSLASLAIRKSLLYKEIKEALDTRDLFISLAAHELRTPLTSVNGYVQLIKSRQKQRKSIPNNWIEDLDFESKRLQELVEEFLEINKIKTGKIQYIWREEKLKDIIERVIISFKFSKPNRKIILGNKIGDRDKIIGDRNKLSQLFGNILENSLKYSPAGKDILITLEKEKDFLSVSIEDKGQGIAREDMPLIFKGFYKGKNSMHEGMGLGLYLAKSIVEEHHGEIEIQSRLNVGTKVIVKLPIKK